MSRPSEFDRLCVVLVSTRNPLNIGAAARAMSNLGFLRLRVVNPYEASFREARSAVGAAPVLASAEEYKSVAEAVADCSLVVGTTAVRHRELQHALRPLQQGAPIIRKRLRSGGRVALLFGSEKRGLANDDLSHCHWLMHIPTREEHISMNLGQAVAICLYELARGAGVARNRTQSKAAQNAEKIKPATAGEIERVTLMLLDALRASGYLGQRSVAAKEEKVRRMVRRLNLSANDADVWLGMLRQMVWKMKQQDG
ncbi:MAG: RNA methyltransferase [Acidobacteriia bacterium]|nr:RNA methyltransferase [Terriglobia bacterium]